MKMTITAANREIKRLKDELAIIKEEEVCARVITHSEGEDPIPVTYDFLATQAKIDNLNQRIMKIRHAVNVFNVSYVLPSAGMTIDAVLIHVAMLSEEKKKLQEMLRIQEVTRKPSYSSVEISHRNFDKTQVEDRFRRVSDELEKMWAELDLANLTEEIEVDI